MCMGEDWLARDDIGACGVFYILRNCKYLLYIHCT